MSTLNTAQRNAGRDAMNGLFEVGSGDAYLNICDSSDNVLVQVPLNETTVMGTTSGGVSTMNAERTVHGPDCLLLRLKRELLTMR